MRTLRFLNSLIATCLLSLVMLAINAARVDAQGGKIALVIGNANYIHFPQLRTPVNDGEDVAQALSSLGFQVIKCIDGTYEQMENALREFGTKLKGGEVGFFYYAGHAFQSENRTNHLIPIDAAGDSEIALDKVTYHLAPVFNSLRDSGVKLGIVVMDACRRLTPAGSRWPERPGLYTPFISDRTDLLVAYAAKRDSTVPESEGRNSLFTGTLLRYLQTPGLDVMSVFFKVSDEVEKATQKTQSPMVYLSGEYMVRFKFADTTVESMRTPEWFAEKAVKKAAEEKLGTVDLDEHGLGEIFIDDKLTDKAVIHGLKPGTHTVEIRYGYGIIDKKEVTVEAGKTTKVQFEREEFQKPKQSMVMVAGWYLELTKGFLIGKWEVTQGEWREVMGAKSMGEDDWPISYVSWYDAVKYCNARSLREGLVPYYTIDGPIVYRNFNSNGYRLPTEDEWDFAARGGKNSHGYKYAGGNDPDPLAWYKENSNKQPFVVGTKKPNELGIHDMSGNVWEWCWDEVYPDGVDRGLTRFSDIHHVQRGGSFLDPASGIQVDSRSDDHPDFASRAVGFRVVRSVLN